MNRKTLALIILVPFSILSAYAIYKVGYIGIFNYQMHSPAGWQVLADLVIACVLLLAWLIPEAKENGKNPWPWVALTLVGGSFGPLLYLLFAAPSDTEAA